MTIDDNEKWLGLVFCSKCIGSNLLNKACSVPPDMKGMVEDVAKFKCFCNNAEHNSLPDFNLNLTFVWLQDWRQHNEDG